MVSVVLALLKPLMSYRLIVREPTNPSRHVAYASNRWERIVYAIARRVYRFADVIITNSEDNRQSLPAYYGIPIERITTLRNPVSGSTRCNPVRKRDAHAVRLVTAGRVVRSKRIEDIVMAISVLGPGCELAVIGPTPDPRYLQELNVLIAALGLSCRVQFAGETGDLVCALGNHDVFVLASAYEGFPNVLLDAVQAGLPVVASDCDFGPREIVSPTIGLLFEPGNVGALVRAIREVRKEPLSISQRQEALAEYQPQLLATRFERILKRVGQRLD
jgi:glycosyltransferase involved in cell wall biosynthesis